MKLLLVASANRHFGISLIVKNQGDDLESSGCKVDYFMIRGKGFIGYLKNIPHLRSVLKNNQYDIIHAHYSLCGYVAALAGARPLVVSLMGSDIIEKNYYKYYIKFFNKYFWDELVVKSIDSKNKLGFNRVAIIPNGVNFKRFKPIDSHFASCRIGWTDKKIHVLFPSSKSRPEKNYSLADEAVILLRQKGYDINLKTTWGVVHDEMPFYYNASSVVVLPSLWEGSPNSVKEAMSCNIPVVSCDVGDVKWLFGETEGYYIASHATEDFAEKIESAIAFSHKFGRTAGRERIQSLGLDSKTVAGKLVDIYRSLSI